MQLGFVSAILPELPLRKWSCRGLAGYRAVELMCWPVARQSGVTPASRTSMSPRWTGGGGPHPKLDGRPRGRHQRLGYYPNPLDAGPRRGRGLHRHIRKVILAAEMLAWTSVNTFIGRDWTNRWTTTGRRFREVCRRWWPFAGRPRRARRHRELSHAVHARRMAGGKNLAQQPGRVAPHVRGESRAPLPDSTSIPRTWFGSRWTT